MRLVIYCAIGWQILECPQDPAEAWELAERLETATGIKHYVGRV